MIHVINILIIQQHEKYGKKLFYTDDMFKAYLDENNIKYKKNKNDMPNMKYKLIRELKEEHMKMKHLEFLKSINSSYRKKRKFYYE